MCVPDPLHVNLNGVPDLLHVNVNGVPDPLLVNMNGVEDKVNTAAPIGTIVVVLFAISLQFH